MLVATVGQARESLSLTPVRMSPLLSLTGAHRTHGLGKVLRQQKGRPSSRV
jgi:hypothetical protein